MTMSGKISKAQQKAVTKYVKKNYDRINVTFPKGRKADIQKAASAIGESVNTYIRNAVDMRISNETMRNDLTAGSEDVQ